MFEKIIDPRVERWIREPDPRVYDVDYVIRGFSHLSNFSKLYTKWRRQNHHIHYYACLLTIEKKMCHACFTPLINLTNE
jgi:hypothetical protein